jgi:hypothetical protein
MGTEMYQSANDERNTEPSLILEEEEGVGEEEDEHDDCGSGTCGNGGCVWPEDIFRRRGIVGGRHRGVSEVPRTMICCITERTKKNG